jgi:hypothetical protein
MQPIKLDYENPFERRCRRTPLRERLMDVVDVLGGPRGLLLTVGLFALLLGPRQANWIGGTAIVLGGVMIEVALVVWLRRP